MAAPQWPRRDGRAAMAAPRWPRRDGRAAMAPQRAAQRRACISRRLFILMKINLN